MPSFRLHLARLSWKIDSHLGHSDRQHLFFLRSSLAAGECFSVGVWFSWEETMILNGRSCTE